MGATKKARGLWSGSEQMEEAISGRRKQGSKFVPGKFITNMSLIIDEEKYCNPLLVKPKSGLSVTSVHTHKYMARFLKKTASRHLPLFFIISLKD